MIGTPLSHSYPKENKDLQRKIAEEFLLISQVPFSSSSVSWSSRLSNASEDINGAVPVNGTVVVSTFAITGIYVWWANRELDPRAEAIRAELEGGAA